MKVIKIREEEGRKCPCCNWRVTDLYSFEGNPKSEALCSACFMDMIVTCRRDVKP